MGGGPPGMDMGMGQPGGMPAAPQQPAALTAQPKDVWEALAGILGNQPKNIQPQQSQKPEKPKPQLNFLKGVPGF
jgi:hypothetical protein